MRTKKAEPKAGAEARAAYPHLAAWWDAAQAHGRVYSRCDVGRTGMRAKVLLWTIRPPVVERGEKVPVLECCWPWSDGDACAQRLGFQLKARCFVVGGCGFDRVYDVVTRISYLMDGTGRFAPHIDTLNQPE